MTSRPRKANIQLSPTIDTPDVILEVIGEGGGYSIMGEIHQGKWRFWRDPDSGNSWMWDEFDETSSQEAQPIKPYPTPTPAIEYKSSLKDALRSIDSNWPFLFPVTVHPTFAKAIMKMVVVFINQHSQRGPVNCISRWQEKCGHQLKATEAPSVALLKEGKI